MPTPAGYASGPAVAALEAKNIEPLVAIGRTQPYRPYDFCPPPQAKPARKITEAWRITMKAKLETEDGRKRYARRNCRGLSGFLPEPIFLASVE